MIRVMPQAQETPAAEALAVLVKTPLQFFALSLV